MILHLFFGDYDKKTLKSERLLFAKREGEMGGKWFKSTTT